jgi:hypothetical protein
LLRSIQPPTIRWMGNEHQLWLVVKGLVQQQEQSDLKDWFGSGMAATGAIWPFIPTVCSLQSGIWTVEL